METNVHVFHTIDKRKMEFLGKVTPKRWSRLLKPADDLPRFTVSRSIGEKTFDYSATWRTNNSIIGSFRGIAARARVDRELILKLCLDIFSPVWKKGVEKAILSMDDKQCISLPERYMSLPTNSEDLIFAPRRQALIIRDNLNLFIYF